MSRQQFRNPGELVVGGARYVVLALVADKPVALDEFRRRMADSYRANQTWTGAMQDLKKRGLIRVRVEITEEGRRLLEETEARLS